MRYENPPGSKSMSEHLRVRRSEQPGLRRGHYIYLPALQGLSYGVRHVLI